MSDVDIEPDSMNTATMDRPIATSYEIICALDRSAPSSGYAEPLDQPASTTPYTPSDDIARMNSTLTGRSVSCSGVVVWPIVTAGPNGITDIARNAGIVDITG